MKRSAAELREDLVREEIDTAVSKAIADAGHKKEYVIYAAYESDANDCPINNLNDIAIHGKCILFQKVDDAWRTKKSRDYKSKVLENPTWLQVCVCANKMIKRVRDKHHVFLEGIVKLEEYKDDIPLYEFSMGS